MSVEQGITGIPSQRDPRETLLEAELAARHNLLTVGTKMAEVYVGTPRELRRIFPEDTPEYLDAAKRLAQAQRAVQEAFTFQEDVDTLRESVDS